WGAHIRFERRQAAVDQANSLHSLQAALAGRVPTLRETIAITVDVLPQRLKRKMRSGERQVEEKRIVSMFVCVRLERFDGMVRDSDSGVIAIALLDWREPLIVEQVGGRLEKPILIEQRVGVIDASPGDRPE